VKSAKGKQERRLRIGSERNGTAAEMEMHYNLCQQHGQFKLISWGYSEASQGKKKQLTFEITFISATPEYFLYTFCIYKKDYF